MVDAAKSAGLDVVLMALVRKPSKVSTVQYHEFCFDSNIKAVKFLKLTWMIIRALVFIMTTRCSVIYSINPLAGFLATLCKKNNVKKVYETHEIFPGVRYKSFSGSFRHIWIGIERFVMNRADRVYATDPFRMKFLRRFYKVSAEKFDYILNAPRSKKIENILRASSTVVHYPDIAEYRKRNLKVISYCGGVQRDRGIEAIISAVAEFNSDTPSVLYIVGGLEQGYGQELIELANECGLDRIYFTGAVDNENLLKYMSLSDITFALYARDTVNNRLCSPNKIFDAIQCNVSLIASYSPLAKLISSHFSSIFLVKKVAVPDLVTALKALSQSVDGVHKKIEVARSQYSWEQYEPKLLDAFLKI